MKLYHGSTAIVEQPMILETQRLLDFGRGFYTTSNLQQAERWAIIKQKRIGFSSKSFVTTYEFDEDLFESQSVKSKIFDKADEEWLDFVVLNRNEEVDHFFDIIRGPVANDTLYQTLTLFETGILTKPEAIARLKVHPLFDQVSFYTQKVLANLKFVQFLEIS